MKMQKTKVVGVRWGPVRGSGGYQRRIEVIMQKKSEERVGRGRGWFVARLGVGGDVRYGDVHQE